MRRTTGALGWAAVVLAASCEQPRTELVVRVDSELAWGPGQPVQSVVLSVRREGAAGPLRDARTTALGAGGERRPLPLLVGVTAGDDVETPVWIEALGCGDPNGCTTETAVVAQRAVVRFTRGETQEVTLLLASACVGMTCGSEQRCEVSSGRCESATRAQEMVRPFSGTDAAAVGGDAAVTMDTVLGADSSEIVDRGSDEAVKLDVRENDEPIVDDGALDVGDLDGGDLPVDDIASDDALPAKVDVRTPELDTASPMLDAGAPDSGVPDSGRLDVGGSEVGPRDAGTSDAGGCSGAQTRCVAACVDLQTDGANCGSCGTACGSGNACMAGRCATPACMVSASDCNMNSTDGCELVHGTALNTCTLGDNLGAFCGDTSGGFLCMESRSLRVVATRTGNRSRWYRGRLNECSVCPSSLNGRLTLRVPAGVDYDLFVYSACGRLIGSSQALAGVTEQFTLSDDAGLGSFDFYVEVRWFSGASCMPYTLTYEARS